MALDGGCPLVTVLIPAYNEDKTICKVLLALVDVKSKLGSLETIVIDDGSVDKTEEEVARFPWAIYLKHKNNMGKGMALKTGFKIGRGKIMVIQDADMEYSPAEIPRLVEPIIKKRADVVYGSRFVGRRDGMSLSHTAGNMLLSVAASLLFQANVTDIMTGHKAFSREVLDSLRLKETGFGIEVELTAQILRHGWKILEIPIDYSHRAHGTAKIRYRDGFQSLLKLLGSVFVEN